MKILIKEATSSIIDKISAIKESQITEVNYSPTMVNVSFNCDAIKITDDFIYYYKGTNSVELPIPNINYYKIEVI